MGQSRTKIFTIKPMILTNFYCHTSWFVLDHYFWIMHLPPQLFFCLILSAHHHWTEPQPLLLSKGNLGTQADVEFKKQPSSQVHTRNSSQENYKSLKQILSAAVFLNECNLLSEIEAAEKLGGCTVDFQIWKIKKKKERYLPWSVTIPNFLFPFAIQCCNCNSDILHLIYQWVVKRKKKKGWS